jgi:type III pantothenate kinase
MNEPQNVLTCDVGNSRIALAVMEGQKALEVRRLSVEEFHLLPEMLRELWTEHGCEAVAASSVSPRHLALLEEAAGDMGQKVLLVGRELPLPIDSDLSDLKNVGTDRLCSAAMAYFRIDKACVVASFGTAITIDCVDDDGSFLGGAILPGLKMAARALHEGTALLPEVELHRPDWTFGRNTIDAIISGIVLGARGALRELTEAYATSLGQWPPLVATGGDAELVCKDYDIVHAIVPDLCLMGVGLAYQIYLRQ